VAKRRRKPTRSTAQKAQKTQRPQEARRQHKPAPAHRGRGEALEAIEPLILAAEAYPRMEEVALAARSTLLIAMRILEPQTRLVSEAARDKGLETWGDLLADRAAEGVTVRLLVADFDPILAKELHEKARIARDGLAEAARQWDGRLAVLPARHPGELGAVWRTVFWPFVRERVEGEPRRWPPVRLWPTTHHMKIIVADAREMVIGGLDVNERRYDEPGHDRPAEETWQDVSAFVSGSAAAHADRFVRWLWREEIARRERLGIAEEDGEDALATPLLPALPDVDPPAKKTPPIGEGIRFIVTASQKAPSPFAVGPRLLSATIIEESAAIVRAAEWFLYVENQFVRDPAFMEVVVRRMRAVPDLQLVLLVPAAPDTVAFQSEAGAGERHGEWLQVRALDRLMRLFGERVGVFMLAGARLPRGGEVDEERAEARGRGIVYVHSKVLIADDRLAAISSANLNARSLRMDTEAGVSFGGETVATFRQRLWRHHLGSDTPTAGDVLGPWRKAAEANAARGPGEEGPGRFVLTWDRDAAARFAKRLPFVPERYV
jgi:phosphatidylserine/phosphatidylglycerophosphate/cardiolipin synthase-like enzyme